MTTFGGAHEVLILGAPRHGYWPECRCRWLGPAYTTPSGAACAFGEHLLAHVAEQRAQEGGWRAEDALGAPPACVCAALPYEHGWRRMLCVSAVPMVPLGGLPIFDPHGPGIVGRRPAPEPVRPTGR